MAVRLGVHGDDLVSSETRIEETELGRSRRYRKSHGQVAQTLSTPAPVVWRPCLPPMSVVSWRIPNGQVTDEESSLAGLTHGPA